MHKCTSIDSNAQVSNNKINVNQVNKFDVSETCTNNNNWKNTNIDTNTDNANHESGLD